MKYYPNKVKCNMSFLPREAQWSVCHRSQQYLEQQRLSLFRNSFLLTQNCLHISPTKLYLFCFPGIEFHEIFKWCLQVTESCNMCGCACIFDYSPKVCLPHVFRCKLSGNEPFWWIETDETDLRLNVHVCVCDVKGNKVGRGQRFFSHASTRPRFL